MSWGMKNNQLQNPLLYPSSLQHHAVPFDQVLPEHFVPALQQHISTARAVLTQIKSQPASFENTIEALETAGEMMHWTSLLFYNLMGAETNDQLQALSQEVGPMLAAYASDVSLDSEIFAKVQEVYNLRSQLNLNKEQNKLLEETYIEFVRNGASLTPEKQNRLREIDQRLSQLSPKFGENLLKATNQFEMFLSSPEEIEGLPENFLESAKAAALAKNQPGKYLINLQGPTYVAVLKFARHRKTRQKLFLAFNQRAYGGEFDNRSTLLEIVRLKHERSQLLGFQTHAHFTLERRMAQNPEVVSQFLNQLLETARPAAKKDLERVQKIALEMDGISDFQAWDFSYYSEKLKEKEFNFSEEDLKVYFPLQQVVDGVFEVAKKLFDLEFVKSTAYPVFHPEVEVFEVFQNRNGQREFIGLFYQDFFPRDSKRDGAWMTNFLEQGLFQGKVRRPHVSITCNFTKPTATKPSLLTFGEVRTLFHEFGHALHSLLSRCHYRSLSGTNVFWDFVELPSQILENWSQSTEGLALFAKHYQTGEVIPQSLVDKVKASTRFLAGYTSMRQLSFGYLDMAWFAQDPSKITSVEEFEEKALAPTLLLPRPPEANMSCAFGHIFAGGYSAGYYSYKWAEVLDADAFELFESEGIFNKKVARSFEDHILSRGGTIHPAQAYQNFRGRDADPKALLRRDGLIEART